MMLLQYWSDKSCLDVMLTSSNRSHIKVAFYSGSHPFDRTPFDGPRKVLGHAFYPTHGHVHFDDDELWTNATSEGLW